jgi:hypothetical protein
MSAYLFTFRSPDHYAPGSGTFEEWSRWQLELGARLMDRGCPLLRHGGGVEVGELTSHDERFDQWLAGQFGKDVQS